MLSREEVNKLFDKDMSNVVLVDSIHQKDVYFCELSFTQDRIQDPHQKGCIAS